VRLDPTDAYEVEHGYVVSTDEYELSDPGLTDEERAALWIAAQIVRLGGQQGAGAVFKLGGAPLAAAGEPLAADLGADAAELGTLFAAIVERRTVSFRYRDAPRTVHPLGLVHRRGHWYLTARRPDADDGESRVYRVDRMGRVAAGDEAGAFDRPPDFDPSRLIPDVPWRAGGEDTLATVRFDARVAWWARRQLSGAETVAELGDGGLEVEFRVANVPAFIGWLLAFEDDAEIVRPPELRARMIDTVRAGT
jgi:predicted DNA-binding transcriptional regulator YafY